jgi:dTDP-4-dehydrorhamnose 3,5-epimerase
MGLEIVSKELNGLIIFKPVVFEDERGLFFESFKSSDFEKLGLPSEFKQDNHSISRKNVIRGMHFQYEPPQGKFIKVTNGIAFVVEVDIRKNSPTFGKYFTFELSDDNKYMLWIPSGFANGFAALTDKMEMQYKCTSEWNPSGEGCIRWDDPDIAIEWPIKHPIISDKDRNGMTLNEWRKKSESNLFLI